MGIYGLFGPFSLCRAIAGFSAASGIALINSVANLGGFVGPSLIGAAAKGTWGISGGVGMAGMAFFLSAALVLLAPKADAPTLEKFAWGDRFS
jgi:ACS family tartrate transporter-like MFS transporter